jgi:hypothetical protein
MFMNLAMFMNLVQGSDRYDLLFRNPVQGFDQH